MHTVRQKCLSHYRVCFITAPSVQILRPKHNQLHAVASLSLLDISALINRCDFLPYLVSHNNQISCVQVNIISDLLSKQEEK